ncbi:MAG: hypothetical protein N3F65_00660 [Nitrososphaeria archaeon]|nr:hypothetical protein [Nitrososphaeria archaeon]
MRGANRSPLIIILLMGLISRLLPSAFYAHPWDMYIWIKSGELGLHEINIYHFDNPIEYPWGFYAYPPTWLYWLIIAVKLGNILGSLHLEVFLIKLPIIIADIIAAFILYRLAKRLGFDERKSLIAVVLWLFNPVTYFMSSIWGMFDSIAVLFALLGIYYVLDERYVRAGIALGMGAAVKIIPALILLPALIYIVKDKKASIKDLIVKLIIPSTLLFFIISTPFLSSPLQYFKALLQHTKSVGSFTYWIALSVFINLSDFWFIPFVIFGVLTMIIAKKMHSGEMGFLRACALIVASLLATSPKVNIQYINFLIPLLILSGNFWYDRRVRRNFCLLIAAASLWLISSWIILSGYGLEYLGQLYVAESYEISPAYVLMIVSGIFGGTRFIALVMDYLGLQRFDTAYIGKWNVTIYMLVILMGLACIYPTPTGVVMPHAPIRIGIPESPDSAFVPGSDKSVDQFLKHYNVTHVVIALSPDFINTYERYEPNRDVTVYFNFRVNNDRWTQRDLLLLIKSLHSKDVKVLLGIYLKARDTIYRYGIQGFSTEWIKAHPNIVGSWGVLLFNSTLELSGQEISYAKYFSEKIERVMEDFAFDGIYLMDWDDWRMRGDRIGHVLPLIEEIREKIDKPLYIEGPNYVDDLESILILLERADYVVLKTAPWIRQVYYTLSTNSSLMNYEGILVKVLNGIPTNERNKLLFSAYTFSFVEGWLNPAIELQLEANTFHEVGLRHGYAIYYADRYTPYKITIKSR